MLFSADITFVFHKITKKESTIFQDALQILFDIHLGYVYLYYNTDKLNT